MDTPMPWAHLGYGHTYAVDSPGQRDQLAYRHTYAMDSSGLWTHLCLGLTWAMDMPTVCHRLTRDMNSPALWTHICHGLTWAMDTPMPWIHQGYGLTWAMVVLLNIFSRKLCDLDNEFRRSALSGSSFNLSPRTISCWPSNLTKEKKQRAFYHSELTTHKFYFFSIICLENLTLT